MSRVFKCDRCGKMDIKKDLPKNSVEVDGQVLFNDYGWISFDLCQDCSEEFVNWCTHIKEGEIKKFPHLKRKEDKDE